MTHDPLLLATAIEAVTRAGDIQMARFGRKMRIDKKGKIDLVTEVDLEVERMFCALVAERFPDHGVLGEEFGRNSAASGSEAGDVHHPRYRWLFDPIDGTTNYAHGLPIFCASLALELDGQVVVGAVYDPSRQELFTAQRGRGSWLNGVPLRVSTATRLGDSLLCTGFPYDVHDTLDDVVGLFSEFVGHARAVRRLGSAAIDLCYVAAGRLDGFWEQRLKPWDIAAGALMVEEAGGTVTDFALGPFDLYRGEVLASNVRIHQEMSDTIAQFAQRRSRNTTK